MSAYKGVTLIELIVSLSILTLLLLSATPAVEEWLDQTQATVQANQLVLAINYARNTAVNSNQFITICPTQNHLSCSAEWQDGQIAFVDQEHNGKVSNPNLILRVFPASHQGDRILWHSFPQRNYLQLAPSGFTADQNGSFYYCPANGKMRFSRIIIIDKAGRTRVAEDESTSQTVC